MDGDGDIHDGGEHGNTDVASICRGVAYAAQNGASILNCSWGGAVPFNQALYETLRDFPGLIVCSAGNSCSDNDTQPHYPSSFELDNLISVAATVATINFALPAATGPPA